MTWWEPSYPMIGNKKHRVWPWVAGVLSLPFLVMGGCALVLSADEDPSESRATQSSSSRPTIGPRADAEFLRQTDGLVGLPEVGDSLVVRGRALCLALEDGMTSDQVVAALNPKYSALQARSVLDAAVNVYCPEFE